MFKNYVRIAYRNLLKNKISSIVNVFGLSVAIACAIVVFLFLERQYTMDRFHENGERIFLIENYIDRSGSRQLWGDSPIPLGPAMEAEIPQVRRAVRVGYGGATFRVGERVFEQGFWFVDDDFLDLFTYPLRAGEPDVLTDPRAIVLSHPIAEKFFGEENPIGRDIEITFANDRTEIFTVGAVAEEFPVKSSIRFWALMSYDNYRLIDVDVNDWSVYTGATFVELNDPADAAGLPAQLEEYRLIQNAAAEDWPIAEFRVDNLYKLSIHSESVQGDISGGTHPAAMVVLGLVAVFLLALSCFNYMNLAIATASRRLKEIGVRKVVGGSKAQLVGQFLSENILLCMLALVLGVIIAQFLFIPGFNTLFDFVGGNVAFKNADHATLWPFLLILLLVTGFVSGAYPAFYIAGFRPTAIFQGRQRLGGGSILTKSLLTFQFILAFLTMIMGVVLAQNAEYQASKDWGYDQDHLLVLRLQEPEQYPIVRDAVTRLPAVESVVGGRGHFARSWNRPVLDIEGEKMEAVRFAVGHGYLDQYGLTLVAGRDFDEGAAEDASTDVIINERFALTRGWTAEEALGQSFRSDSLTLSVIGVVHDFTYDSIYDPLEPAFLKLTPESDYYFLTMRLRAGTGAETADAVEALWKERFPSEPYPGFFQDEVFDEMYRENTNIKKLFAFIAGLALVIACLGLFGLAAQNIVRRMKEISIRKVLGGSVGHISQVVNRGFLLLVIVAAILATPLGYVAMKMLLASVYPDPVTLGAFPFVLSFVFVAVTALATVATQVYRVAYNNPAEVLRNE